MSFSAQVKSELCRQSVALVCCAAAEVYGALLFANAFTHQALRIITGSGDFAQRLPRLFQKAFGFGFDRIRPGHGGGKTVLEITDRAKIGAVFAQYGCNPGELLAHHINFGALEEDAARACFLRGAFLAGGSITDPAKRYHLELVTDHKSVAGEAFVLLREMGFAPKETRRKGHYVIYFKQSEAIEDLLTAIGAPVSAMELMNTKAEKLLRNGVNRRVNCEAANVDKTVDAALGQRRAIQILRESGQLETLSVKLQEAARLREENPELSLTQLAALCDPPVTKSSLGHRLRKLIDFSKL